MDIVKIFAGILTGAGMLLMIFACLAFLQGTGTLFGVGIDKWGSLAPFLLGTLFFVAGVYLLRFLIAGRGRS